MEVLAENLVGERVVRHLLYGIFSPTINFIPSAVIIRPLSYSKLISKLYFAV